MASSSNALIDLMDENNISEAASSAGNAMSGAAEASGAATSIATSVGAKTASTHMGVVPVEDAGSLAAAGSDAMEGVSSSTMFVMQEAATVVPRRGISWSPNLVSYAPAPPAVDYYDDPGFEDGFSQPSGSLDDALNRGNRGSG